MRKIGWLCLIAGLSAMGAEPDVYICISSNSVDGLVLELKQTGTAQILDAQEILSRYKAPEYELRDVTGDGVDEILVYTRGGGTGCVVDQLSIYAVCGEKLIEAARFELEGSYSSNPGCCQLILHDGKQAMLPIKEGKIKGAVEFLTDDELLYCYAEAVRDCEKLTLDFKIERHRFNPATAKFELNIP